MTTFSKSDLDRAVQAERARIKAVAAAPEFRGRERAAVSMLVSSDMTAEKVIAALAGIDGPIGDFEAGAAIAASLPAGLRRS